MRKQNHIDLQSHAETDWMEQRLSFRGGRAVRYTAFAAFRMSPRTHLLAINLSKIEREVANMLFFFMCALHF